MLKDFFSKRTAARVLYSVVDSEKPHTRDTRGIRECIQKSRVYRVSCPRVGLSDNRRFSGRIPYRFKTEKKHCRARKIGLHSKKHLTHALTFAVVFVVVADRLPVVDQRPFRVQVRARPVRQRLVIQMEQLAIVRRARRRSFVDERPAQKLVFDFTRQPTR